jgi:hypothetical protein
LAEGDFHGNSGAHSNYEPSSTYVVLEEYFLAEAATLDSVFVFQRKFAPVKGGSSVVRLDPWMG